MLSTHNALSLLPLSASSSSSKLLMWPKQQPITASRGVATGWTGVDMSTPLLPEVVPEIDTNPVSFFYWRRGG